LIRSKYPRRKRGNVFENFYIAPTSASYTLAIAMDRQIFPLILDAINSAKKEVFICAFQFSINPKFLKSHSLALLSSILSRQKDGVNFKIILNRNFLNPIQKKINFTTYNFLRSKGFEVRTPTNKKVLHSKIFLIDDTKAIIGSSNITANSFYDNYESCVLINSPDIKTFLKEYMTKLWNSCTSIWT